MLHQPTPRRGVGPRWAEALGLRTLGPVGFRVAGSGFRDPRLELQHGIKRIQGSGLKLNARP